jgi:hypothetical protein
MIRCTAALLSFLAAVTLAVFAADNKPNAQSSQGSLVIVFKDGHRQTVRMSDVARIEFNTPETARANQPRGASDSTGPGRNYYIGKWEVGMGDGLNRTLIIELKSDGNAEKSIGAAHGTWTVVDGEARIIWDDGARDAIRKVGSKHEKFAYAGKSFSGEPSNVTEARPTQPRPL